MKVLKPNPPIEFAPFWGWDAPTAHPSATRWASSSGEISYAAKGKRNSIIFD